MNKEPKKLKSLSEESIISFRENKDIYSLEKFPYFGYYSVDIFDCPSFTMFTNNDCPRAIDILYHQNFEPMSIKIWSHLIMNSKTAIDIGAHVGIYSLVAAALRQDIDIHAFEPNPDVFSRLLIHCNVNKFQNIKTFRNAFSNKNGITKLFWVNKYVNGWLSSGSTLIEGLPKEIVNTALVNVSGFDNFYKGYKMEEPFVIKIDIEGAEELAIESMQETIKKKPDIIIETFSEKAANKISSISQESGYSYFLIDEIKMKIHRLENLIACDPTKTNFNQLMTTRPEYLSNFL